MPRIWNDTIEAHRRDVNDAILDTTVALVAEHGLLSVTMSQIAEETGIGRATLYKYFSGVDSILQAWHERHVAGHLNQLTELRDRSGNGTKRLEAVLGGYASIQHELRSAHATELAAHLHRGEHLSGAQSQLRELVRDVLAEAAAAGSIRRDVAADELAQYCLHALAAARTLPSKAAVRRLVWVTLDGLQPPGPASSRA